MALPQVHELDHGHDDREEELFNSKPHALLAHMQHSHPSITLKGMGMDELARHHAWAHTQMS